MNQVQAVRLRYSMKLDTRRLGPKVDQAEQALVVISAKMTY
jgi:hypothetical protein